MEIVDGAIVAEIPAGQRSAYRADDEECIREAGIDPDAGLTDEEYRIAYDWYVEIENCLSGAGFSTPPAPSFETFRSTYDSDPWIPWQEVSGPDLDRAFEACPVMQVP